jgi:hypothetical protein
MNDDTDALQHAIEVAGPVATIIPGTWYVDATRGLNVPSGKTLNVYGYLQALPNGEPHSSIINVNGATGVTINVAGQIIGDRDIHIGTAGEWGMGISLINSSDVTITGPGIIWKCWGDGIYVIGCSNVKVSGINSLNNRRNDMSVISVDGLSVTQSAFNNAKGTAPQCGIDLEPDNANEFIKNVDISGCQFVGNSGAGVMFGFGGAPQSNFQGVRVHDNLFKDNKPIGGLNSWYANLMYALFRNAPGYDWWGFPREITL